MVEAGAYPKRGKGVGGHLERALVDPVEKGPEHAISALRTVPDDAGLAPGARPGHVSVVVQDDGRRGFVLKDFAEDSAGGCGAFLVVVASAQLHQDLWSLVEDVGEGRGLVLGWGRRGPEAEDVREDDLGVLSGLKGELVEVDGEEVEQVFFDYAEH